MTVNEHNNMQLVRPMASPFQTDPWSTRTAMSAVAAPMANLGAAMPPIDGHAQHQPFRQIHRMLRGRYFWAVLLAILGAAAGAYIGFRTQKPQYRSDGLIKIEPFMSNLEQQQTVMPMYTAYVETQAAIIQGQRVIQKAMESDEWRSLGRGMSPEAIRDYMKSLDVGYVSGSFFIRVSFSDPDPNAAPVAVKSMIQSYLEIYGDVDTKELREKLQFLEARRQRLVTDKRSREDQLFALTKDSGGSDLSEYYNANVKEMISLRSRLREAQFALSAAQAALGATGSPTTQPNNAQMTYSMIAEVSPIMRDYLMRKEEADAKMDALKRSGIGESHPEMQRAKGNSEFLGQRMETFAKQFMKDNAGLQQKPDGLGTITITPAGIAQLKRNVEELRSQYEKQQQDTSAMGERNVEIQKLNNEIKQAKENLDETTRLIDQNNVTLSMNGRLKVLSYGDKPVTPAVDKRLQASVLGFIAGGALPLALFLLIGLFDQRYRYSDEAGTDMSGVPLLGILPNLPDLLTDPRHAAIAAYCVHQVRTLLQIRVNNDRNQIFTITSASPGDGKTSLALALGLSFAASGSRTLLIDSDIVGGALTRRLKVVSSEGILDAMSTKDIRPFVRETDIANVSLLPVGGAGLRHASSFSPNVFRRIVSQARDLYDIILIDTGPILGSIEASCVAASADGVILTVARGQHRIMVERALAHLNSIGARFAGVVFNRAETRDFEKSVSRFSMRSVREPLPSTNGNGNGNGHSAPAEKVYGPVAHAVANSFREESEHDSGAG